MASIFVTNRQADLLQRCLTVNSTIAGLLIAAGFSTVKKARAASVAQLTAIQGIDASKAAAIRGGSL